jgi:hypothetical protein
MATRKKVKPKVIVQMDLFGNSPIAEPKKVRNVLSPEQKAFKKEKDAAHMAWKIYKSSGFKRSFLKDDQMKLLKKHYPWLKLS